MGSGLCLEFLGEGRGRLKKAPDISVNFLLHVVNPYNSDVRGVLASGFDFGLLGYKKLRESYSVEWDPDYVLGIFNSLEGVVKANDSILPKLYLVQYAIDAQDAKFKFSHRDLNVMVDGCYWCISCDIGKADAYVYPCTCAYASVTLTESSDPFKLGVVYGGSVLSSLSNGWGWIKIKEKHMLGNKVNGENGTTFKQIYGGGKDVSEQTIKQWIDESVQNPVKIATQMDGRFAYYYYPIFGKKPMVTIIDTSDTYFKGKVVTSYPLSSGVIP